MSNLVRPNLFIVGGMKCGTTILSDYLAEHPEIVVASGKEIHYFTLNIDKGDEWYLSNFEIRENTKYAIDASPTYLDTCNTVLVPKLIKKFNPDAKIIILIRDPVDRLISHFNHLVKIEKVPLLQDVSAAEFLEKKWIDELFDVGSAAFYFGLMFNFSSYYQKIATFSQVFGKKNVLLVHNDDLRHHGRRVMKKVFEFLDVAPIESDLFEKQRYLGGGSKNSISFKTEYELYKLFSPDYIASCKFAGVERFAEGDVVSYDRPSGAISGDVAFGEDGWLFLVLGTNRFIDFFTDDVEDVDALMQGWVDAIRNRAARCRRLGARYFNMFIPEKLTIYNDKLPWHIDPTLSPSQRFARAAPQDIADHRVDLYGIFSKNKDKLKLYHKTDSHWTNHGAFLAYQMICSRLGIQFDSELLRRPSTTGEIVLDLGSKVEPARTERATFQQFVMNARLVEEGEIVSFKKETGRINDGGLHVGSVVRYRNDTPRTKLRAVLFGDSFSEFREHLLTGLLAETFAEFTFVWSTSVDFKLIEELKPDIVLSAMTERFMNRLPNDEFDVRAYASDVVKRERAAARPK